MIESGIEVITPDGLATVESLRHEIAGSCDWWVIMEDGVRRFYAEKNLQLLDDGLPEYSQGVMGDGVAILKDGQPMSAEQIVAELTAGADRDELAGHVERLRLWIERAHPKAEILQKIFAPIRRGERS